MTEEAKTEEKPLAEKSVKKFTPKEELLNKISELNTTKKEAQKEIFLAFTGVNKKKLGKSGLHKKFKEILIKYEVEISEELQNHDF